MNILAILAHHDDEALLCGGTLLKLRELGHKVVVCIATGAQYSNTMDNPVAEAHRYVRRCVAFFDCCGRLGAHSCELRLKQGAEFDAGFAHLADLVITHGNDTGHPSHKSVMESVKHARINRFIRQFRVMYTSTGKLDEYEKRDPFVSLIRVPIDLSAKQKLLDCYRYGTTRTPEWRPQDNPAYAPWCGDTEHFTADPEVARWWQAQFPSLAGGGHVD